VNVETNKPPKLAVLVGELSEVNAELIKASDLYSRMKATIKTAADNPASLNINEMGLKFCVGDDLEIPVSLPQEHDQLLEYLRDACAGLGEEVIRLWAKAHRITGEADATLAKAAAAAQAATQ